ncbi:hypothetical protein QNN88_10240 [Citrobacter sp. ANG330]|uniref:hypothetical protein n=1 Tax=Citrobacter sp. ANG330 TaxID=3048142 RepID=UPI0039C01F13
MPVKISAKPNILLPLPQGNRDAERGGEAIKSRITRTKSFFSKPKEISELIVRKNDMEFEVNVTKATKEIIAAIEGSALGDPKALERTRMQEKAAFVSSLINKEIDLECRANKYPLKSADRKAIFKNLQQQIKGTPLDTHLNTEGSVSGIAVAAKSTPHLSKIIHNVCFAIPGKLEPHEIELNNRITDNVVSSCSLEAFKKMYDVPQKQITNLQKATSTLVRNRMFPLE